MDSSKSWVDCDSGNRAGVHSLIRNTGENGNAGTATPHVRETLDNRAGTGEERLAMPIGETVGHKRLSNEDSSFTTRLTSPQRLIFATDGHANHETNGARMS